MDGAGAGLDVTMVRQRRTERMFEHTRSTSERGIEIAVLPAHVRLQIVARHSLGQLGRMFVFVPIFVNQR